MTAQQWARDAAWHGLATARRTAPPLVATGRRARAATFAARLRVVARWHDATVVADIAPTARIGAVTLQVWPHTHTVVRVGADAHLGDGVLLSLRGGSLEIGDRTDVRRLGTYHVGGRLHIGPDCMLSTGVSVHCADAVEIGRHTLVSEYSTVVDSWHLRTPPDRPIQHAVATRPTRIGSNVWIGARVTVAAGASVGDQCVVGSNAVVTSDIPPGWLAVGAPARAVRELPVVEP